MLDENFCGDIVNGGLFDFDRKRDAAGIGGLSLTVGKVTLTEVACALILGILVNLFVNVFRKKKPGEPVATEDAGEELAAPESEGSAE